MGHFPETTFRRLLAPIAAPDANTVGGSDTIGHSSVQAWSAGDIFPAVISIVESYEHGSKAYREAVSLESRRRYTAYDLTLDGVTERFSTYEDARDVARMLLADPVSREQWRATSEIDGEYRG
jgi:hypothetical protein